MILHLNAVGNLDGSCCIFCVEHHILALDFADVNGACIFSAGRCHFTGNQLIDVDLAIGGHCTDGAIHGGQMSCANLAGYALLAIQHNAALL